MERNRKSLRTLIIKDGEGKIPVSEMRLLFERAVANTERWATSASLETVEHDGKFSHYKDPDTNLFWFGFAIGMRMAWRLRKASHGL